jgi:hypothetical protein
VSYSAPPNFTTGAIVTEAQLDTLSNDITFLANPPKARVYNSANISIPDVTDTALTFNSERFDTDTMHSTVSNTGRITFTTAGTYLVGATVEFAANATGRRHLHLRVNGSTYIAGERAPSATAADTALLSVATLYAFSAADYVEVVVYQNSTAALNVTAAGNRSPEFWAIWQSL